MPTTLSALLLSVLVTSGVAVPLEPGEQHPPTVERTCPAEATARCPSDADRLRAFAGANLRHRLFQIGAEATEDALRPAPRATREPAARNSAKTLQVLRQTEPASSLFIVHDRLLWPKPRGGFDR